MKTNNYMVYYFSKSGSNAFLSQKIAEELNCEREAIKPKFGSMFWIILNLNFGIKKLKHNPANYKHVILCGPIFMGRLITPLRSFIKKNAATIKHLSFVSCCGSSLEKRNEKFGHALVFEQVKSLLGNTCHTCVAFPIEMVLNEADAKNDELVMKTRLSEANYEGAVQAKLEDFIDSIRRN